MSFTASALASTMALPPQTLICIFTPRPAPSSLRSPDTTPARRAVADTSPPGPPAFLPTMQPHAAPLSTRPPIGVPAVKERLGRSALLRLHVPPAFAKTAAILLCSGQQASGSLPPAQTLP